MHFGILIATILMVLTGMSSHAQAGEIACWNKQFGKRPLEISFDTQKATFSFDGHSCDLERVNYKPISATYKGWIRFGNLNPYKNKIGGTACSSIMTAFHQQMKTTTQDISIDVHWVSLSTELQKTSNGRLQLGYENIWDPGSGGTVKTMLGCRPKR